MTTRQLYLFNTMYLVITLVVAVLTRATWRRFAGSLVGATSAGLVALGALTIGEARGWWHMAIRWEPYYLLLFGIDFALTAFIFLVAWRIARRFGWRGLAVALVVAAVIGPLRDYQYIRRFPEWGSYAPGIAPILAVSATYVLILTVGHAVMRLIAGAGPGGSAVPPALGIRLARRLAPRRHDDQFWSTHPIPVVHCGGEVVPRGRK